MGLIIDTSAIIELERNRSSWSAFLEVSKDEPVFLPSIVWAELLVGVYMARDVKQALNRRAWLDGLRAKVPVIPFSPAVAEVWAELFADLKKRGTPVPANDLCVLSTALHLGYHVVVGPKDEKHFQSVGRVKIIRIPGS